MQPVRCGRKPRLLLPRNPVHVSGAPVRAVAIVCLRRGVQPIDATRSDLIYGLGGCTHGESRAPGIVSGEESRSRIVWPAIPSYDGALPRSRTMAKRPTGWLGVLLQGCLTMTYFRTGTPYYHRRATVSRSCSRWEGVVPAGYGRQALTVVQSSALARHGISMLATADG